MYLEIFKFFIKYSSDEHFDFILINSITSNCLISSGIFSLAKHFISREILKTDSMEYSSYYQPYVIPYNSDDEITYFYSYDLIHEDDKRPDANIVGPSSAFYLNRSKSVTAKHQPSVMKNRWKENTIYKVPNMLIHSCKILFEVEMLKYLFLLKTFL